MQNRYSKEVADYLNNKFGDDFTLAEPYPYWMDAPDQEDTRELVENNNKLKTHCIMSKTKDWFMDLEEAQAYGVSLEELPALREELEKMRQETAERAKRVPSYIPVEEPEDDGLPF